MKEMPDGDFLMINGPVGISDDGAFRCQRRLLKTCKAGSKDETCQALFMIVVGYSSSELSL